MIPANVITPPRLDTDASVQPVPATRAVVDVLGELVPGQRLMAHIQGQMANGAYRALVGQRDVTLALPFAAASGDSLELEVVESNGKTALAFVARESARGDGGQNASAATNLSRTGAFIAELLSRPNNSGAGTAGSEGRALPLNGNQPLAAAPPQSGADLVPLLKQAVTQSGMFYEAHQAQWIAGKVNEAALRAEPQGQLSLPPQASPSSSQAAPGANAAAPHPAAAAQNAAAATSHPLPNVAAESGAAAGATAQRPVADAAALQQAAAQVSGQESQSLAQRPLAHLAPGQIVAPEVTHLVQQQLEALATQNYVWQGQAWPGQSMRWEIEEDERREQQEKDGGEEASPASWRTRLTLTLPHLGGIDAVLRLSGGDVTLGLAADSTEAVTRMRGTDAVELLRDQFEAAGLHLTGYEVKVATPESEATAADGETGVARNAREIA